ncbi:MAG: mandelate racemase/muconate lactonizing enzyme family protein [Actinobacteria bacterium]|nr:MAG: mandelate racemase/muconate lactonizing enzyme family protein [Actinomycetota bacterium]
MRVTQIDTIRLGELPNLLFVEVRTDEGLVGLGETFFGVQAVEAYVHESAAPYLLGRDPLEIEKHARALDGYVGYAGTGAERRGASAIDIALWDILGQVAGLPLYQLFGGETRDSVPIYNTCAGYRYVRDRPTQSVDNWGVSNDADGPYEDLDAFLHRADELSESLRAQSVAAMKIWPFDPYAEASGGTYISREDLNRALEPLRKIRGAVGDEIEIMVELHGLWNAATATQIMSALEEFEPYWIEDPVRPDDLRALAQAVRSTTTRVAVGETLGGLGAFRQLLDHDAADMVIVDPAWAGGITVARKVAAAAESYGVPVTFHDCTGPVVLTVDAHLAASNAKVPMQETVRAYYTSWYGDLVTALPPIAAGTIRPPDGPGLGIALRPGLHERADAQIRTSTLAGATAAAAG